MMRRYIWLFWLCFPPLSFAGAGTSHVDEKDLYFGEAFYSAYQYKYVDAISLLDIRLGKYYGLDKPNPDPLHVHLGDDQFTVGDFELSYRMRRRAGNAFKSIFESNGNQSVRNEAAYRLARVFLQNDEPQIALQTIEQITGKVPESIKDDESFLRAQIYLANGKFADATKNLHELQNARSYKGFAAYNLGVALIKTGQDKQGLDQLEKAGQISGDDDVALSIKDKANLALGYRLIENRQPELAKRYLDLVRLTGPFSNKALLGSGWADVAMGRFESALVPWSVLAKRNVTDKSVQESMMGVSYAYAKLNLPGKAALMYGRALDGFGLEMTRLDESIKRVREGRFLHALLRDELKQDENWITKLRDLPDTPETHYLLVLMASDDFQDSLKNYLDLDDLLNRLETWDEDIRSYEEIIYLRRQYYESLLPDIDKQLLALDSKLKFTLEQRQNLDGKMKVMQQSTKPEHYDRFDDTHKHLEQLDVDVKNLQNTYASVVSLRQSATQNYQGYDEQIRQLKKRVQDARVKVNSLITRQGQMLEMMAINELNQRHKHLQDYQAQARFALAESYERASRMQAPPSRVK